MKQTLMAVLALAVCLIAPALMFADTNPNVGTWKLNLRNSSYPNGTVAPKSMTRTVTADGDKVKYVFEGEAADGSALKYSFTVKYDGNDYAISGTGPFGADHVALKKIDSQSFEGTLKKGNTVVVTVDTTVSHDGKTATVHSKGTDKDGKPVRQTQVFNKQ
jgi:hypothetical protein